MKRLIQRHVTTERPGEAKSLLRVSGDQIDGKTQGSDFWSFGSLYFSGASTLLGIAESQYMFARQMNTLQGRKGLCRRMEEV